MRNTDDHQEGCAWMERGSRFLARGVRDEAIRCQRRAVRILSELPDGSDLDWRADLASAWVNLGAAVSAAEGRPAAEEALHAFDQALAHLDLLSEEPQPRFRHNRAAALMNRADALAKLGRERGIEALQAYDQAIAAAAELPLDERPAFRILLGACWINRGNLHLSLDQPFQALEAWEKGLGALGSLPETGHRAACHHAATAWINRGEALLGLSAVAAVGAAKRAWKALEGRDIGAASTKLELRVLRVLALGLEALDLEPGARMPIDRVVALADLAEWGLEIAFESRAESPEFFDPFVLWFFSLGCRTYGRYQPQFLGEFLKETLERAGPDLRRVLEPLARAATDRTLARLGARRLIMAGTPATERLLGIVRSLRDAIPCPL